MSDTKEEVLDDGSGDGNPLAVIQAPTMSAGQKRTHNAIGGPASKKAHIDTDEMVQVKVLIPAAAVGAIIGKGGETMRALKNDSKCRVQMSKNQEMYHGTNERICMVKGKIPHVMMVMQAVMEKIREKVDPNTASDQFDHKGIQRIKEMKLLVPNTSAGMVIGKAGARIKEIRDATGAQIQVFPKAGSPEAKVSLERVITVAADENDVMMAAISRVLEKVAADPQHANPIDSKDADNFGSVFSGGPIGGSGGGSGGGGGFDFRNQAPPSNFGSAGFGQPQQNVWSQPPQQQNIGSAGFGGPPKDMYNGNSGNFKFNPMQGLGNNDLLSFLDSLQSTLRTSGFNEASVAEIMQAMQVLAKYNIMGLGLGLGVAAMAQLRSGESGGPSQQPPQPVFNDMPVQQQLSGSFGGARNDAGIGNLGSLSNLSGGSGGVLIDVLSQDSKHNGQNFAATVITEVRVEENHVELEVPDAIVGAVLGPRAKTLGEIQHHSGCKVEVHKRNTMNGAATGNRLISLTGDADSIRVGRLMIERVINEEQARRNSRTSGPPF